MTTTEGFVVEEVRYKMRADGPCLAADPCGSLGGVWCGAQRRVGGLLGRNMEPLFYLMRQTPLAIVCLPGSQSKLITSTVTFHGGSIDGLFFDRRHTHWDSSPPAACPPSPCINIDRLTRSHQRPYRCFLPAATLDLPDQRPISAPSQKSRASPAPQYGLHLANWGKWATSCSALVVFSTQRTDQGQTNLRQKICLPCLSCLLFSSDVCGMLTLD